MGNKGAMKSPVVSERVVCVSFAVSIGVSDRKLELRLCCLFSSVAGFDEAQGFLWNLELRRNNSVKMKRRGSFGILKICGDSKSSELWQRKRGRLYYDE